MVQLVAFVSKFVLLALAHLYGAWAAGPSLLLPVGIDRPAPSLFPPASGHILPPANNELQGRKGTNKFWANWMVASGKGEAIFTMPYALKWGLRSELQVSHGDQIHTYADGASAAQEHRIRSYVTPVTGEFGLGALELAPGSPYVVVKEGLFGIHVEVRRHSPSPGKVSFPIYSGMAYVSGRFSGGITPRITSELNVASVRKVHNGIWAFRNGRGSEFRVYALTAIGERVDASYDFDRSGQMNRELDGWVRMAHVVKPGDEKVLDTHAGGVIQGCELQVDADGIVRYMFEKVGSARVPVLHFAYAHQISIMGNEVSLPKITPSQAPTKGPMRGVSGDVWVLRPDLTEAEQLGFLPKGVPSVQREAQLIVETAAALKDLQRDWRKSMFRGSFYFSGKGFQKVAMVCLLAERFFGAADERTQGCGRILAQGFRCLYDRSAAGDCSGAPIGFYYDEDWGGVVSREGYGNDGCYGNADFGNACYNDHHYHYGYYVVAGAVLIKILPVYRHEPAFLHLVNALIRDTSNPSMDDPFFPMFRSFDWFDLHSWSRGVVPSPDGKDEESTSEELNLLYGIHLWGDVTQDAPLHRLGTTMLALCAHTVREFFLMEDGNSHYHPDFARNHVTGIFFQNKVDYTTWFGGKAEYIHGIQMLPLSPALLLTRKAPFCLQEWRSILSKLPLSPTDPWTSILLTGGLAIINPDAAYEKLANMRNDHMDDGLTRVWALYWAASQVAGQQLRV